MSQFLSRTLADLVRRIETGDAEAWALAEKALQAQPEDDVELFVAIDDRDLAAMTEILAGWDSGKRSLPQHDRNLLKRALKAFRKRLKVVRLDADSSIGGGPMSSGRDSGIVGVRPPDQFPQEVWDLLVKQGRLLAGEDGMLELPPE